MACLGNDVTLLRKLNNLLKAVDIPNETLKTLCISGVKKFVSDQYFSFFIFYSYLFSFYLFKFHFNIAYKWFLCALHFIYCTLFFLKPYRSGLYLIVLPAPTSSAKFCVSFVVFISVFFLFAVLSVLSIRIHSCRVTLCVTHFSH